MMAKDGTRITNEELDKFRLNVSRCGVAPLKIKGLQDCLATPTRVSLERLHYSNLFSRGSFVEEYNY